MDSPKSVVSPLKSSPIVAEVQSREAMECEIADFIGVLEIYIHQARDIHNICIYQKQDVYAKICLTSDPNNTVSTQIINGGGKNPVFNENLRLNVKTINSSLKCEVWMLSRVKNYLEDQLLGFALVPLSEVLISNGKLENDFALSSTDLFHSPAGFVQLSLSYAGASPEVMAIPAFPISMARNAEVSESATSNFDNIEFPDPNIANENQMMVSEYFSMPCSDMDSESSESFVNSDTENHAVSSETNGSTHQVPMQDSTYGSTQQVLKQDSPHLSVSTNDSTQVLNQDSPPISVSTNGSSCDTTKDSNFPNQEHVSLAKEKNGDGESDFTSKPVVSVNIEPENNVVQQDIVDMYMKSMQQFTDSLAKMKLPLDNENGSNGSPDSGNSSSEPKSQASKNSGSRVFYGSRAFF